jgi:phage terminase small subunit
MERMPPKKKKAGKLTVKQKKFAKLYAATGNGAAAARAAGYSKRSDDEIAAENLRKPQVRKAIHEALEESLAKAQLKSDHVIEQLRRIAFSDISEIYHDNGLLKHPVEMSDEARVAIAGVETTEILGPFGAKLGEKKKLKIADKTKALELLGKTFGIFKDVVETKNTHSIQATEAQVDEATQKFKDKL